MKKSSRKEKVLHKLLQKVSRLGHGSEFEAYVASLHEGRRSGVPALTEAQRDFQAATRYKMLVR